MRIVHASYGTCLQYYRFYAAPFAPFVHRLVQSVRSNQPRFMHHCWGVYVKDIPHQWCKGWWVGLVQVHGPFPLENAPLGKRCIGAR